MTKKLWKVCNHCGVVTDLDEVCCPLCRRNPLIKKFFDKKVKTQEMIASLEKDKAELEKELIDLVNKATSFNLSLKNSSVKNYVKDLEVSFKQIEKKKNIFSQNLIRLTEMIKSR